MEDSRRFASCGVVDVLEPVAELSFIETLQSETESRDAGAMTGGTVDRGYGRRLEMSDERLLDGIFASIERFFNGGREVQPSKR